MMEIWIPRKPGDRRSALKLDDSTQCATTTATSCKAPATDLRDFGAHGRARRPPQLALYAALASTRLRHYSRASCRWRNTDRSPRRSYTGEVVSGLSRLVAPLRIHAMDTRPTWPRACSLAPTGSIAIPEQTRKLVEGYFRLKPLGRPRLRASAAGKRLLGDGLGSLRTAAPAFRRPRPYEVCRARARDGGAQTRRRTG